MNERANIVLNKIHLGLLLCLLMLVSVTIFVEAAAVEYYLNEVSGSLAADSSGNGNDGTVVNAPVDDSQWVAGADGGGVFTYSTLKDGDSLVLTVDDCGKWGYNPMDFDHDCKVDLKDMSVFIKEWLKCSDPNEVGCEPYN